MKNTRIFFLSENFLFLVVKFSMYLKRHVFVMWSDCAYTQADLNLRWARITQGTCSHFAAHLHNLEGLGQSVLDTSFTITLHTNRNRDIRKRLYITKSLMGWTIKAANGVSCVIRNAYKSLTKQKQWHSLENRHIYKKNRCNNGLDHARRMSSRKHTYIILTPLNPTFI